MVRETGVKLCHKKYKNGGLRPTLVTALFALALSSAMVLRVWAFGSVTMNSATTLKLKLRGLTKREGHTVDPKEGSRAVGLHEDKQFH